MTVWVVVEDWGRYEGGISIVGVFSTSEAAHDFVEQNSPTEYFEYEIQEWGVK